SGYMKRFKKLRLVIEGHCDERGTAEYNLALGERRARAAYEFLILLGVDSDRIQIVSYGEERPLASGSNEAAWAENRRAEVKVLE
ncbi:MAG: OmpA family protein, partial [Desulfonatronovibrio sp.]